VERDQVTGHFIGAGPGAADLLTVRATRLLATSPVCLYAGTYVTADVLAYCPADAELVDTAGLTLDQITERQVAAHRAGHDVARLCSGDPSLYSALHEQTRRLDAADVPWDVTPGIPAYAAAAALLGKELTVPGVAQSVVLTRAQARSTPMPATEELERFAATGSTLVLHLAITRTRDLADRLLPFYGAGCPVAVVSRATQHDELVLRDTLVGIADLVERAGLRQAAVIIVGPAVGGTADTPHAAESHLYSADRARMPAAAAPRQAHEDA
jgi:precorrin-4/cobalt-precorrin-4 C11-methyltransferase